MLVHRRGSTVAFVRVPGRPRAAALVLAAGAIVAVIASGVFGTASPAVATSSGTVSGRITADTLPVAHSVVQLTAVGREAHACYQWCSGSQLFATTDANGRYTIKNVPRKTYTVLASAPTEDVTSTYLGGASTIEAGKRISAGGSLTGVDISLVASATLSGRVTAADAGAQRGTVDVQLWSQYQGHWHRVTESGGYGGYATPGPASDPGRWTVGGVMPGTYKLRFAKDDGDTSGVGSTWWGGRNITEATTFTVRAGDDLNGFDATVRTASVGDVDASTLLSGPDRWAVSAAVTERGIRDGVYKSGGTVFVTSGQNYPDALSAAPAAAQQHAPLMLTATGSLPSATRAEVIKLRPTRIVVVGGTPSVSNAVWNQLHSAVPAARLSRIDGRDRYEVSRNLDNVYFPGVQAVMTMAGGRNFPDALSAATADGIDQQPLLLVDGRGTPDAATERFLDQKQVSYATVVGGQNMITDDYATELSGHSGDGGTVTPLRGTTRYDTSRLIAERSVGSASTAFLVDGQDFPDALAASALAASEGAPLITTLPTCLQHPSADALEQLGVTRVVRVGGRLSPSMAHLPICR